MNYSRLLLIVFFLIAGVYCSQAQNITTDPANKFAYLLSGSTDQRYVEDIKMVYDALTKFYNYPLDHIWVIFGDAITDISYFSGSNITVLSSLADLNSQFTNFKTVADISSDNTLLLFFTGNGTSGPILTLEGLPSDDIDYSWFEAKCMSIYNGQLNIVMQQSNSDDFEIAVSSTFTASWSFTNACTDDESPLGSIAGSNFTKGWTSGLQFETISSGANAGKYADELSNPSSIPLHISLEQAKDFADNLMNDITQSPQYSESGGPYFLGSPEFLIRDGDHKTLTDPDYESPDIFLTHPFHPEITEPDIYLQDTDVTINNIINVRVLNVGTHPVRKYYTGVTLYDSEIGGLGEHRVNEIVLTDEVLCPIPMPDDETQPEDDLPRLFSYISQFDDINFPETTHQYIRAKVEIEEFTPTDLETWTWDYSNFYNEAQRNIDLFGTTGIINSSENDEFRVHYSNGTITLFPVKDIKLRQAEIYNSSGKLVYSTHLNVSGKNEIDFSESSGYYILKIITDKKNIIKKFIVY